MKVLQIIKSAYRCTVEEQDDPAVWITHALKGAGGELSVLLSGNAVNYAARGQDASGLSFGGMKQTHPPTIDSDVASLVKKGVPVYAVREDAAERGIDPERFVDGVEPVGREKIAALCDDHDQVWTW